MVIRIVLWFIAILVALTLYAAGQNNGIITFVVLGMIAEGIAWFVLLKKKHAN